MEQCFYDNIIFAPFIYIEDPVDVNGQRRLTQDESKMLSSSNGRATPLSSANESGTVGRVAKIDPYFLITQVGVITCPFLPGVSDLDNSEAPFVIASGC